MVPLEAPQADGKAGSPEWKLRSHLWLAGGSPLSTQGWPAGNSRIFLKRQPPILYHGQVNWAWQNFTAAVPSHPRATENFSNSLPKTVVLGQQSSPVHSAG